MKITRYEQPFVRRRFVAFGLVLSSMFGLALDGDYSSTDTAASMADSNQQPSVESTVQTSPGSQVCIEKTPIPVGGMFEQILESLKLRNAYFDTGLQADYIQQTLVARGVEYNPVYTPEDAPAGLNDPIYQPLYDNLPYPDPSGPILGPGFYPSELVRSLDLRISVLASIDSIPDNPNLGDAAGVTFNKSAFNIGIQDIAVDESAGPDTFVHEIAHALQTELCNSGSRYHQLIAELQSSQRQISYLNDRYLDPAPWLIEPSEFRQFAVAYGAQSEHEDWATLVTEMLTSRGMVLPGDVDWGSVYQLKQYAIIEDIEAKYPGFKSGLVDLTNYYRICPASYYNKYMNSNFNTLNYLEQEPSPQEAAQSSIESVLNGEGSIEYLNNVTAVYFYQIDEAYEGAYAFTTIQNPLVIRNAFDQIAFIGSYSVISGELYDLRLVPYDPGKITLIAAGNPSLLETSSFDSVHIEDGLIAVNHSPIAVWSGYFNDNDLIPEVNRLLASGSILYWSDLLDLSRR
ncbi:hypothetical protein KC878_01435 [Candidatus Saccharibacteria bacterium]|nr:hypothetical protein [Candidatus Saccharibacteria bacterium]